MKQQPISLILKEKSLYWSQPGPPSPGGIRGIINTSMNIFPSPPFFLFTFSVITLSLCFIINMKWLLKKFDKTVKYITLIIDLAEEHGKTGFKRQENIVSS